MESPKGHSMWRELPVESAHLGSVAIRDGTVAASEEKDNRRSIEITKRIHGATGQVQQLQRSSCRVITSAARDCEKASYQPALAHNSRFHKHRTPLGVSQSRAGDGQNCVVLAHYPRAKAKEQESKLTSLSRILETSDNYERSEHREVLALQCLARKSRLDYSPPRTWALAAVRTVLADESDERQPSVAVQMG